MKDHQPARVYPKEALRRRAIYIVGSSKTGCLIPLKGRQQLHLCLLPLLLPSSLYSYKTESGLAALKEALAL
jgi:hypothetical protein